METLPRGRQWELNIQLPGGLREQSPYLACKAPNSPFKYVPTPSYTKHLPPDTPRAFPVLILLRTLVHTLPTSSDGLDPTLL